MSSFQRFCALVGGIGWNHAMRNTTACTENACTHVFGRAAGAAGGGARGVCKRGPECNGEGKGGRTGAKEEGVAEAFIVLTDRSAPQ